jgi:hypothetical protein
LGEEQMVFARKLLRQSFESGAGGPVTRVPADPKSGQRFVADPGQPGSQAIDIGAEDIARLFAAAPVQPVARSSQATEVLEVVSEDRKAPKYYLEAIVIGGIVAAGYLNADRKSVV